MFLIAFKIILCYKWVSSQPSKMLKSLLCSLFLSIVFTLLSSPVSAQALNESPIVSGLSNVSIETGDTYTLTGAFSDPDSTSWFGTVFFGDGTNEPLLPISGNTFTTSHVFNSPGYYGVNVYITDEQGNVGEGKAVVYVSWKPEFGISGTSETLGVPIPVVGEAFNELLGFNNYVNPEWPVTIDYGDGTGAFPLTRDTIFTSNYRLNHVYQNAGIYTIKVEVVEGSGLKFSNTVSVQVTNRPEINLSAPEVTFKEGEIYSSTGSFTDPDSSSWEATVDYGDGTGEQPLTLSGTNFVLNHTYQKPPNYGSWYGFANFAITVVVADEYGVKATKSFIVYLLQNIPMEQELSFSGHAVTVTIHDPTGFRYVVMEGQNMPNPTYWGLELLVDFQSNPNTGNYYDSPSFPISQDTISYTFNLPDSTQYLDNTVLTFYANTQDLVVYDGWEGVNPNLVGLMCISPQNCSEANILIPNTPLNQPPVVDSQGPYEVILGDSVLVSANGSDPENGSLSYVWDLDNNGSFETSGQNVSFSSSGLSAGSYTISAQVTDDGGLTATGTATVNVITAQQAVGQITTSIQDLVSSGTINTGLGNSLKNKLQNAIDKLNQGDVNAAKIKLQAFISQVTDLINTGALTSASGQPLIDSANSILSTL